MNLNLPFPWLSYRVVAAAILVVASVNPDYVSVHALATSTLDDATETTNVDMAEVRECSQNKPC
jgi:hypothetical protein